MGERFPPASNHERPVAGDSEACEPHHDVQGIQMMSKALSHLESSDVPPTPGSRVEGYVQPLLAHFVTGSRVQASRPLDIACKARSTVLPRWPKGHQSGLIQWLHGRRPWKFGGDPGGKRTIHRRISDRSEGRVAQRGRCRPSFLMRDSKVVGFRPSRAAARAGPLICQPVWAPGLRYLGASPKDRAFSACLFPGSSPLDLSKPSMHQGRDPTGHPNRKMDLLLHSYWKQRGRGR